MSQTIEAESSSAGLLCATVSETHCCLVRAQVPSRPLNLQIRTEPMTIFSVFGHRALAVLDVNLALLRLYERVTPPRVACFEQAKIDVAIAASRS